MKEVPARPLLPQPRGGQGLSALLRAGVGRTGSTPSEPYDPGRRCATALERAVHRQLMTDVPYGVLALRRARLVVIAAVAARYASARVEDGDRSPPGGRACTPSPSGSTGSPDLAPARRWPRRIGTVHHGFAVHRAGGARRAARRDLPHRVVRHHHRPGVDADVPDDAADPRDGHQDGAVRRGSDEIFGGYLYFHKAPNAARSTRRPCASSSTCTCTTACAPTSRWRPGASRRACRSSIANSSTSR